MQKIFRAKPLYNFCETISSLSPDNQGFDQDAWSLEQDVVNFKIGRKLCIKVVFFSKNKSLLKVFFQEQKWSYFGLIFMKLGLPAKLGTLLLIDTFSIQEVTFM